MKNKALFLFTNRLSNAVAKKKPYILLPYNKFVWSICSILLYEGFIRAFFFQQDQKKIFILLKYKKSNSTVSKISLFSFSSRFYNLRRYRLLNFCVRKKILGSLIFSSNLNKTFSTGSSVFSGGKLLLSIF